MPHILIIEDDPLILDIYKKKFADSEFQVSLADSGEKALEMAKKEKIDVVLVDMVMPQMDGFEVIRRLRGGEYDPNMKIIGCSNLSQDEDRNKALELGANEYVAKSGRTPSELIEEIKRIVDLGSAETGAVEKEAQAPVSESGNFGQAKKVLLVEDEDAFLNIFGKKLSEDGFEVAMAQNGEAGLQKLQEENFDLFIINLNVPVVSGQELIEKIKGDENLKNIPIIALTSSASDDGEKMKSLGVEKFFVKTQVTPMDLVKEAKILTANQ